MKKIFSPKQKAQIALEALKGLKSPNQLSGQYGAHPIQIGIWKKQLAESAHAVFSEKRKQQEEKEREQLIGRLYQIIGQRDTELEWLKKNMHLNT